MKVYDYFVNHLEQMGMFKSQATEVMNKVVTESRENVESINREFKDRWGDDSNDYPPICLNLVFMGIEPIALEYIKETCPEAWFRPIFDKEHPLRKEFEATKL